jgi:hypothetical protein
MERSALLFKWAVVSAVDDGEARERGVDAAPWFGVAGVVLEPLTRLVGAG